MGVPHECNCSGNDTSGHQYGCAIFKCRVCGELCPTSSPTEGAVCEKHCPDHEYEYERGEGHRCIHCNKEPDPDWFSVD